MDSEFGDGSTSTMTWGHVNFLLARMIKNHLHIDPRGTPYAPWDWYILPIYHRFKPFM